jgi:hypothetical protein
MQEFLGHAHPRTLRRYVRRLPGDSRSGHGIIGVALHEMIRHIRRTRQERGARW